MHKRFNSITFLNLIGEMFCTKNFQNYALRIPNVTHRNNALPMISVSDSQYHGSDERKMTACICCICVAISSCHLSASFAFCDNQTWSCISMDCFVNFPDQSNRYICISLFVEQMSATAPVLIDIHFDLIPFYLYYIPHTFYLILSKVAISTNY